MKTRGKLSFFILTIFLLALVSFVFGKRAFSYDTNVAHSNIADLAVQAYNQQYPNQKLTAEQANWIKQGAIDEDTPTRWLNHFYDPVYNRGVWFVKQQLSARDWHDNPLAQRNFSLGDYSWSRALSDLQKGDKEQAFKGLGHLIHLLSDMTVPAHTRDDIHVVGDSYEQFLKYNWLSVNGLLKTSFSSVSDLSRAFDELANYSNNNFYSDDTISDENYSSPSLNDGELIGGYVMKKIDNKKIRLLFKNDSFLRTKKIEPYWLDDAVLMDYSTVLLPRAISYSAGAIKLFLDEANKSANNKVNDSRISLQGYGDLLLGGIISAAKDVYDYVKNKFSGQQTVYGGEAPTIAAQTTTQTTAQTTQNETQKEISPAASGIPLRRDDRNQNSNVQNTEISALPTLPLVPPKGGSATNIVPASPLPVVSSTKPIVYQYNGGGGGSGGGNMAQNSNNSGQTADNNTQIPATTTDIATSTPETMTTSTPPVETPTSTPPVETPTSTPPIETPTTTPIIETPTSTLPIETPTSTVTSTSPIEETPTSTEPVVTSTVPTVVFNEIAWMGTGPGSANAADEWLELYNNTDADIDLADWKILVSGKEMSWNKVNSIITARGYYLLERTDDNAVLNISADGIFTVSGGLNNNGENLQLLDAGQKIIDEVNASSTGWFAGKIDGWKYRTMARIDSESSGLVASNWKTSEAIAPKVLAYGGSAFYGSPRLTNAGYWLLRGDLSVYYSHLIASSTLHLTKDSSPYIIDNETMIPAGLTVEIDTGVILYGANKNSYFKVAGSLFLNGASDNPVVLTSALDMNFVENNLSTLSGSAAPGDWSRIEVEPGGQLTAGNVKFFYGGNKFFIPGGFVFGGKNVSQIIRNLGGTVNLDNVEFASNYLDTDLTTQFYNTVVWTETPLGFNASTTVRNSLFNGGWTAINNYGQNNGQKIYSGITDNTFQNFANPTGLVVCSYSFPVLSNNVFVDNVSNYVDLGAWTLAADTVLNSEVNYSFNSIVVPYDMNLTLNPGVNIKLSGNIQVEGSLRAEGAADNPINVIPKNNYWGILLLHNSTSSLKYVNLARGNGSGPRDLDKRGMVTIENSVVDFDNVNFMDAKRPFNMLYLENSAVSIKDSIISWTDNYTGIQNIDGINFHGGSLHLDNVTFNRMNRGIEIYNMGIITMENMGLGNFQNISSLNWWPANAFSFSGS